MTIEAGPSDQPPRSASEGGVEGEDSTWDESSAFLPKSAVDEEAGEVEEEWSAKSLGQGFIWIQTGMPPMVFQFSG
jgi:hypothetical protein